MIINGFQPLTIIPKRSILDVKAVLDPPLVIIQNFFAAFLDDWRWLEMIELLDIIFESKDQCSFLTEAACSKTENSDEGKRLNFRQIWHKTLKKLDFWYIFTFFKNEYQ